jgi:hypothetical protein
MGKAFGPTAVDYAQKKALERVTGQVDQSGFKSHYMERGTQLEPLAIDRYELDTFNQVTNGGFSELKTYGDSTDGMVGADGCIEIKSVIPKTQWKTLKRGSYDPSYKWQIQGHLFISGKEWCDWASYCPEFPESKQLLIHRVEVDQEMQEQLIDRLRQFELRISDYVEMLDL